MRVYSCRLESLGFLLGHFKGGLFFERLEQNGIMVQRTQGFRVAAKVEWAVLLARRLVCCRLHGLNNSGRRGAHFWALDLNVLFRSFRSYLSWEGHWLQLGAWSCIV